MAMGSISLDGPTYLMWGALLVFGLLSLLVFSERDLNNGATAFAASAASVPGSPAEAEANRCPARAHRGLPAGAVLAGGHDGVRRRQRPADRFRGARGDVAAALPALRDGPSAPPAQPGGGAEVLPARRAVARRSSCSAWPWSTGSPARSSSARINDAIADPVYGRGLLYTGMAFLAIGLLFKIGAVPFHNWVPDVYVGAPTPVTGFMAICTKLAAVGATVRVFFVAFGAERWTWQPLLAASGRRHHGARRRGRPDPDRHEAPAGLQLDLARRLHPGGRRRRHCRGHRAGEQRRRRSCSTWSPTVSRRSRRSPSSPWCATRPARCTPSRAGPGWAARTRCWPASSRCSCSASPASR